jgi:hypothetical protein
MVCSGPAWVCRGPGVCKGGPAWSGAPGRLGGFEQELASFQHFRVSRGEPWRGRAGDGGGDGGVHAREYPSLTPLGAPVRRVPVRLASDACRGSGWPRRRPYPAGRKPLPNSTASGEAWGEGGDHGWLPTDNDAPPSLMPQVAAALAPGSRLAKRLLVSLQNAIPVRPSRDDIEIFDQESDNGFDRDTTGRQMEPVECQRVASPIGVDMRPTDRVTFLRSQWMPMKRGDELVALISDFIDVLNCAHRPGTALAFDFDDDIAMGQV